MARFNGRAPYTVSKPASPILSRASSSKPQGDIALRQPLPQASQLDIDDGPNLLAAQRMEHHDLIDPVDEFRPEMLASPPA